MKPGEAATATKNGLFFCASCAFLRPIPPPNSGDPSGRSGRIFDTGSLLFPAVEYLRRDAVNNYAMKKMLLALDTLATLGAAAPKAHAWDRCYHYGYYDPYY